MTWKSEKANAQPSIHTDNAGLFNDYRHWSQADLRLNSRQTLLHISQFNLKLLDDLKPHFPHL